MKSSKKEFIVEAEELLQESQGLILEMQETFSTGVDPDTINALFRSMHTLKGVSGLFSLQGITNLSHALETLMDDVRLGKIDVDSKVVNFLFKNLDILRGLVGAVSEEKEEGDISAYLKDIETFRASQKGQDEGISDEGLIDESILKVLTEYEEHRLKSNIKDGKGIFLVKSVFSMDVFDKSLEELTKTIKSNGELISTLPTSTNVPEGSIGFNLLFGSAKPIDKIKKDVDFEIDTLIQSKTLQQPKPTSSTPQPKQETLLKSTTTTVRVDIEKIDRILNTIGELALTKGAIRRIWTELLENFGHTTLVHDVHKVSQSLERRLAELQDQVLEIRMVPIGQIFARLAQVIRRYSNEVGKNIELLMYGEDTELDKFLAEEVVDPLMHIIRNSIDHGMETSEERKKKGKKEIGIITLKAYQRGNHVLIEVKDDGAGVDVEKVRKKAIEKGIIDDDVEIDEREIIDFIFTPGFSTKEVADEVSGRGVGMDVVKERLSALGGFAEVETKKDVGTIFILTLPITLAIIKALIVRVGRQSFAVPLTSILETMIIEKKDIQTIESKEVYYIRGEMLPMIRISKFFGLESDDSDRAFAVVVGLGERKVGIIVDELLGQHEVVIKSLGDYFKKLRGFAGAAEIGKHKVILVLDIESLIDESVVKQKGSVHA